MKNLKKIFAAVLILAALVTAVVITVLAADDDEYTGTVEAAVEMLKMVDSKATNSEKSSAMQDLYEYIETIDPSSEGYQDLIASFNGKTLTVAQGVLNDVVASPSEGDSIYLIKVLYAHITNAPIFDDVEEEIESKWEVMVNTYNEVAYELTNAIHASVELNPTADNLAALCDLLQKAPITDEDFESYDAYVLTIDSYNALVLSLLEEELSAVGTDKDAFFKLAALNKKLPIFEEFCEAATEMKLAAFVKKYDVVAASVGTALTDKIVDTNDYKVNAEFLKEAYSFSNSANFYDENSEAPKAFFDTLNVKAMSVAKKYCEAVEVITTGVGSETKTDFSKSVDDLVDLIKNCPSLVYRPSKGNENFVGKLTEAKEKFSAVQAAEGDEKLDKFADLYAYLLKTPLNESEQGVKEFLESYETMREEISEFVITSVESLDHAPKVSGGTDIDMAQFEKEFSKLKKISAYLITTPVSLDAVNTYNGVLFGFTATMKDAFDSQYGAFDKLRKELDSYLTSCPIDPEKIILAKDKEEYKNIEERLVSISNYVTVKSVTDFIYSTATANEYASESGSTNLAPLPEIHRAALAKAINDIMNADILDYKKLTEKLSEGAANSYTGALSDVQAMMVEYNDAQSLETKMDVYAEIYKYLKETPVNPKLDGYELFFSEYETVGKTLYNEMLDSVESVADMQKLGVYFKKTPISPEAINAYNMKYLYVYRDNLNEQLAVYSASTDALHEFMDEDGVEEAIASVPGLSEAIDNYEILELTALVQLYNLVYLDDDAATGTISLIGRGNALKKVTGYNFSYPISENSIGAAVINGEIEKAVSNYNEMFEENRKNLDSQTPFEEYAYDKKIFAENFDNNKSSYKFSWSDTETGGSTGSKSTILPDEKNGGYYWEITYGNVGNWSGCFFGNSGLDSSRGLVMEFDIMSEENKNGANFARIEYATRNAATNTRHQIGFFRIRDNKIYACIEGTYQSTPLVQEDIMVPGEWTHITAVFLPADQTMSVYVDYQHVGTWSVASKYYDKFSELRVSGGFDTDTKTCFDNFDFYPGTNYRIKDKFENMEEAESFRYYVDYMCNETYPPTSRLAAYQRASKLYSNYSSNEEFKEYIEKFDQIDLDADIMKPAKESNLVKLNEIALPLAPYLDDPSLITSESAASVQVLIEAVESFISENSAYLDLANSEIVTIKKGITDVNLQVSRCDTLLSFVKSLKQFERAYSHSAKLRYYESATKYYDLGDFKNEEVRALLASDPAVLEFESFLNDGAIPGSSGYIDVFTFYSRASEILNTKVYEENSVKIIDCVKFLTKIDGYENLESMTDEERSAFWSSNYAEASKYANIIRAILKSEEYDAEFQGLDEAIALFEKIDSYIYEILQGDHAEYLSELIARYPEASSYIEKLGVCTLIETYISENDLDSTNPEIAILISKYGTYLNDLAIYKNNYETVLVENTKLFINIANRLSSHTDYEKIKALYDEAMKYYYEMNVDSDEAKAAIAVFEAYGEKLAAIEEAYVLFSGYANELKAAKNDAEVYEALVKSSKYIEMVKSVDSLSSSVKYYNSKLDAYNEKYLPRNAEIEEANRIVCSVRTNAISEAVLAVVSWIFNR